jgi:beta-lactamase regulating signal transducer with metallopeptidase domain
MSPDLVHDLGRVLVHFLWQGTVLALLLQPILAGCSSAATRYNWSLATLAVMGLSPVLTFLILHQPGGGGIAPNYAAVALAGWAPGLAPPSLSGGASWLEWFVFAWLAGVTGLSLRMLGGWLLLERLRRREIRPLPDALMARCRALQRRLALARPVRFVQSALVPVPAVIGWFRPAVLIPVSAIAGLSPQQLDAIILHELAHIRRLDAFANLFQILIEILLFYHPAIWWVSRRIRAEREHCCDDVAVSIAGDALGYARALTLLEARRALPSMALAATGGALTWRVTRLLGLRQRPAGPPHLAMAAIALICLAGSVTAGHALTNDPEPAPPAAAEAAPSEPQATVNDGSYIGALAAAGLANLSADQLIALKVQGVDPAYVAAVRKAGFEPTIHDLLTLHTVGVRPEDAAEYRALGLNDLSIHQLVTFRALGVTPGYVRALQEAGLGTLSANDCVTAKATGVTPDFVATLRSHGITDLSLRKVTALKNAGVF